jgi:hypothetical protein
MQMSNVRLLTSTEETQLVKILDFCVDTLPLEVGDEFMDYVTEALRQNKTKQLLTHENEKWVAKHSYRHGAESVIGTAREFLVFNVAMLMGLDAEFIHDEKEQVARGRDLRITVPTRSYTISVKPRTGKNEHEARLGQEFFKPTYDPDGIALVDFNTMKVNFYDYPHLKLFHMDNRHSHIVGDDPFTDRFWCPSPNHFMEFKF